MMITRRNVLAAASAAAFVTPFAGFASKAEEKAGPIFSFGVVADPQYAPIPSNGATRFYANSLWKLSDSISSFDKEDLKFVVTLGDIIDRYRESYHEILPLYDRLKHPRFFLESRTLAIG